MIRQNFNADWTFYSKDDPNNKIVVRLPYDAMRHEKRIPNLKNGSLVAFFPSGDYFYEKEMFGEKEYEDKTVVLEFEGVYMDSHVYLNGEEVGGRVYGYSNFYVDLTDKLIIGKNNTIKVFVHNSQVPNGRWYTGSGIYRPVKLMVANKEHIVPDGVKVTTKSYQNPAILEVSVESEKKQDTKIVTEILWNGEVVAVGEGAKCEIKIDNANLWDSEHPNLYQFRTKLLKDGIVLDEDIQRFGIRQIEWSAEKGLQVNGNSVKLRGGCIHHDNGILGAESYARAEYRRIQILKEGGFNAIRGAHDPKSRAMLDACDELGMYVMEESFDVWFKNGRSYGYVLYFREEWSKDITSMVKKCFNHPSVIMYSIGNEISESATDEGVEYGEKMTRLCHELDDSRPVTSGINLLLNVIESKGIRLKASAEKKIPSKDDIVDPKAVNGDTQLGGSVMLNNLVAIMGILTKPLTRPKIVDKPTRGIFSKIDIAGYNYGELSYEKHHEWYPKRIIVGTETRPPELAKRWKLVEKCPYVIGDFMWAAWDYLGECGVGVVDYVKNSGNYSKPYPTIAAGVGVYDITGLRDTQGYETAIIWGTYKKPFIAARHPKHFKEKTFYGIGYRNTDAINSWSFDGYEEKPTTVIVYSQGASVELLINGESQGKKNLIDCKAIYKKVIYKKGVIEAISRDVNGKEISRDKLVSAREETELNVIAETNEIKSGGDDICYINISLTDNNGVVKPISKKILVNVEGEGKLLAVGSGAHKTAESYVGDTFSTHNGRMLAVVRSTEKVGEIAVTVSTEGLQTKKIFIKSK